MNEFRSHSAIRDGALHITILDSDAVRSYPVRCVLDLTYLGDVVGVEVLDLVRQLGGGSISPARAMGEISWSYDDEIDALYLHVAEGSGQVQRTATATARLDDRGHVVDIVIEVGRAA